MLSYSSERDFLAKIRRGPPPDRRPPPLLPPAAGSAGIAVMKPFPNEFSLATPARRALPSGETSPPPLPRNPMKRVLLGTVALGCLALPLPGRPARAPCGVVAA